MIPSTPHQIIQSLRITALLEGVSYLLLLFIAMPIKYILQEPVAVQIVGMAHGLLFIALCLFLFLAKTKASLDLKLCAIVFIASLFPFGAFWADRYLKPLLHSNK